MSMPKNYISLSANVGFGFEHYGLNYLKGIKWPESELTSAKVPLTVSIHDKVALKLMQHRHSASSQIRLPALRSENFRQDNSGFVCLTAARPLRIVQNGENQNQNSGAELDKLVVLLLSPIPVVFSPLLYSGFTLSQVNVCTKESTLHLSEMFPERRLPTCRLGVSKAISGAELLREASAPAVSGRWPCQPVTE